MKSRKNDLRNIYWCNVKLRRRSGRKCGGVPTDKIGSNSIYVVTISQT